MENIRNIRKLQDIEIGFVDEYLLYHDNEDQWMRGNMFRQGRKLLFIDDFFDRKINVKSFSMGGRVTGVTDMDGVEILVNDKLVCKNNILWTVTFFDGSFICLNEESEKGDFIRLNYANVQEYELMPKDGEYYGRA